tara:strand:+ start:284 stop:580 length:297 start_codon:yes stop_codon:yes gene_type:complete
MYRITNKDLELAQDRLNKVTGSPLTYFGIISNDKFTINVGHYAIGKAYGAYNVERTTGASGGVRELFGHGKRYTKRELHGLIMAYCDGVAHEILEGVN